ncbi:MAG: hypothetical protein GDA49_12895 [Rhodospirillales bacterium]|nr:hypothetical protein [Rhodospirillales bacterium]
MATETTIQGEVIFGTERGLKVQGNGILSRVPVHCYEFDRQHDGVIHHHIREGETAFFARRLQNVRLRKAINLFGAISPCRDVQSRPGFFGVAVAVQIDNPRDSVICTDWSKIEGPVNTLMDHARELVTDNRILEWRSIIQQDVQERPAQWQVVEGQVLEFHLSCAEQEDEVPKILQALTFEYAGSHETLLVFKEPTPNSVPLDDERVLRSISAFDKARSQASSTASSPAKTPQGSGTGNLRDRINALEEIVEDLVKEIDNVNDRLDHVDHVDGHLDRFAYTSRHGDVTPDDADEQNQPHVFDEFLRSFRNFWRKRKRKPWMRAILIFAMVMFVVVGMILVVDWVL